MLIFVSHLRIRQGRRNKNASSHKYIFSVANFSAAKNLNYVRKGKLVLSLSFQAHEVVIMFTLEIK